MKNIYRISILLILIGFSAQGVFAQRDGRSDKRAKIIQAKKAHIEESISFTQEESEKFWALYDSYHRGRHDHMTKKRKSHERTKSITDEEAETMLDNFIADRQAEMQRHIVYLKEARDLLGAKRVLELQRAERTFNTDVLKSLKTKKRKNKKKDKG